ncbi:MAG: xanthine dehydrogenase accessory protein XdhC [Granulosicoccus sp.]
MDWLKALYDCRSSNQSCVVVMIAQVEGSAPREVGTRMVVTDCTVFDTIGGGAVELEGIAHARALLHQSATSTHQPALITTREINLGKELAQCCGGKVTLQFDCHLSNSFVLHVFGAGHVGQEVARLALRLPCVAVIHDTREEWLERVDNIVAVENKQPETVKTQQMDLNTHDYIESLDGAAFYLVMTHSHELDMDIVEAILSRSDAIYCGLIASDSKAAKFRNRLKRKGFEDAEIQRLSAPLGLHISTGNTPMEVAIAGMSDVLNLRQELQGRREAVQTLSALTKLNALP